MNKRRQARKAGQEVRQKIKKENRETEHRYNSPRSNNRAEGKPKSMKKSSSTGSQQNSPPPCDKAEAKGRPRSRKRSRIVRFMFTRKK